MKQKKQYENTRGEILKELKNELRPELINRIDDIIVFHKLEDRELFQITDIMLRQIEKRLKENKYCIKVDSSVLEKISAMKSDKSYGARPLRRNIKKYVEDKIAEDILDGKIMKEKEFVFKL